MIKSARKPSTDPVQEKLRQNKAVWNKEVSLFIGDLINLKKLMNGWPSKFHMERSFIKDPLPADPGTILGVLTSDFQDLSQKGNSIISQQLEYSKNRKQKQLKPPGTDSVNLTKQLAASQNLFSDYNLVSDGSNTLSRFFSRLKGPWIGSTPEARARKYRLAMLRAAAVLEKELQKFEVQILKSSADSIFIASKMLFQIENHLLFINDSLGALNTAQKNNVPTVTEEGTPTTEETPPNNEINAAKEVIADFRRNYANFTNLDSGLVKQFSSLILKFISANDVDKNNIVPEILNTYQAIIAADANTKSGTTATSLADILLTKKASMQLEVIAQNIVNKWLGKAKHHIDPFDKTSALRLDINKESEEIRKNLDKLMNSLEKDINQSEISLILKDINERLVRIKALMKPLEATIRGKLFDRTFVDLLEDKKITDHSSNLSKKQKEQLEKMLQTKQFREFTNLYSRK